MSTEDQEERLKALGTLFQAVLERKANKAAVEACKPWSDDARPEDVARIIDMAIDEGVTFEKLKPAVSKLLNLLYDPLRARRYQGSEEELFLSSLLRENVGAADLLSEAKSIVAAMNASSDSSEEGLKNIRNFVEELGALEVHYLKKENILFPGFEARYPEYRCIRLMWSIHDDVRRSLRRMKELCEEADPLLSELNGEIGKLYFNIHAVIFREECIVFPIMARLFACKQLNSMFLESVPFGFCFLSETEVDALMSRAQELAADTRFFPSPEFQVAPEAGESASYPKTRLRLDAGAMSEETVDALLKTLPLDMTFVDASGRVAWFSNSHHRIFPRTPSILGRDVRNCHPKESVERVEAILDGFKQGHKDRQAFWIQLNGRFIHIEYFALRNADGRFLGTLEVSQDLTEKRALAGERRLADDAGA